MGTRISELFIHFNTNGAQVKTDLKEVNQEVEQFGKKGTRNVQEFESSFGSLATTVGLVAGAVVGAGVAINQAYQFAEAGAGIQRLEESGNSLAQSLGSNMDHIVSSVRAASLNTVSDVNIMQSANRAMMLNLGGDADKMANLMQIAAFRARAMGISTTQAFNDIVTGIGRQSPLILDNLGIVFDANTVYAEYAEKIGDADGVLETTQKTQALYNEVLEVGNELMAIQGGLAADNATNFERLNANFQNTKNNLSSWFAGVFDVIPAGLNLALYGDSAEQAFGFGLDFVNTNTEYFDSYNDYLNSVASGLESSGMISQGFGDVFLELYQKQDEFLAFQEKFGSYISSSERYSFTDAEKEIYNLSKAFESLLIQTGRQNDLEIGNFEDYMMSLGLVSEETFNASQEVAEFYDQNVAIGQSAFTASGALWEQAYATTGYSEATWEAMHAASALETAEKEKNEALLEAGNIMDQLKTKTSQLEAAQLSWGLSVSNDIVSKLEAAGISGDNLVDALGAIDQQLGSNHLLDYEQNQFIDDMIASFSETGSLEDFKSGLEELQTTFMPLDQDIQAISTDIMTLQMQLSALERTYNIDVVLDVSGSLAELGIPSVTENALEGADYLGGSGSAEGGGSSGRDIPESTAFGTSFTVPAGYPNDSYLWSTYLSSGERVSVNPSGAGGGGGNGGVNIAAINVQIDHEGDLGELDVRALAEMIAAEFRSGI